MDLSSVKIVGGPLYVATMTEVDLLEQEFEASFPVGYREYVTTLGKACWVAASLEFTHLGESKLHFR